MLTTSADTSARTRTPSGFLPSALSCAADITNAELNKAGEREPLRFPQFHQEILYQNHWEAGELLGRIRVIIAEGISRQSQSPQLAATENIFERVKDVVVFSFQHAPLRKCLLFRYSYKPKTLPGHFFLEFSPAWCPPRVLLGQLLCTLLLTTGTDILEFSGIAWPNASMWKKSSGPVLNASATVRSRTKTLSGEEVHAHSARRPTGWTTTQNTAGGVPGPIPYPEHKRYYYGEIGDGRVTMPSSGPMSEPRLSFPQVNIPSGQVGTNGLPMSDDPFTGSSRGNVFLRRSKKFAVEDTPMPDYASSTTERTRVRSDNSLMSYEPKDSKATIDLTDEAVIVEMVRKMSPEKKDELLVQALSPTKTTGIHAPSNSPTSTARLPTRPSPVTRPQVTSYEYAEVAAEVADQAALLDPPSPGDGKTYAEVAAEVTDRAALVEASSPPSGGSMLEEEAIKPADIPFPPSPMPDQTASSSPALSVRSRKSTTPTEEEKENEPRSCSTSVQVTRSTSTSYRYAISIDDRPILIPSNTNRPRSDSSGSKRKRSSSPTRDRLEGQADFPSPHKRMSQEPQAH